VSDVDKLLKTIYVPKYHKDSKNLNFSTQTKTDRDKLDHFVRYI